jgi:predicted permease
MWRDVRDALRGFGRTPAFTTAATLALGIAIGANAAIFSLVDGLWLRPPGIDRPGELVRLFQTSQTSTEGSWSYPEFEALGDRAASLAGVMAVGRRGAVMAAADGTPDLLLANVVSLNFFSSLGVRPAAGRLFSPADAPALEAEPAVVLGHAFWQRRFGGNASIVGTRITLGIDPGTPVVVLGVLPSSFRELDPDADRDLWMPVTTWVAMHGTEEFASRADRWFDVVGRLGRGQSAEAAGAEVEAVAAALAAEWPETNTARGARVVPDLTYRLRNGGSTVAALMGLVLIVVLITCVNVAHLLMARAAGRRRELALRTALGAGRRHLVRQLFIEAGVLGALGAAAGLLAAAWLIRILPWVLVPPPGFRSFEVFQIDGRVALFTLGVTMVTTLLFGLAPAFAAARTNVNALIKGDSALTGAPHVDRLVGRALVVGQIAVSLALVYGAAVLAESFRAAGRSDLGFSRAPMLTAWIPYGDAPMALLDEGARRVAALPGVADVAVAIRAPLSLSGSGLAQPVVVPGGPAPAAGAPPDVKYAAVSANYFEVLGGTIGRGRAFTEAESRGGEPVALVNEAFVDRFFPGVDPVGRFIRPGGPDAPDHRVLGVTTNAAISRIGEPAEPYFYVPYWRERTGEATLLIRPAAGAGSIGPEVRAALRELDPRLDPRLLVTMGQYIEFSSSPFRTTAALATTLSAIGLLLMTLGIYGVMTYQTARRTREIGIRVAVGAARGQVLRLVLGEGWRLVAAGLVAGVPLALGAGWAMTSLLFGVGPWSAPALVLAAALLAAAVSAATFVPAWRATRVNPMTALRES